MWYRISWALEIMKNASWKIAPRSNAPSPLAEKFLLVFRYWWHAIVKVLPSGGCLGRGGDEIKLLPAMTAFKEVISDL